ncbi:MAG: protein kinase domain-containing protein [Nannocystales bacterium]
MASWTSHRRECLDDTTVVAFVDGQLSDEDRAAVDSHVDGCPACLALVAAMARSAGSEHGEALGHEEPGAHGPHTVDLLRPGSRVGRYEIIHWLGHGGMGTVYAAHDPQLDRDIALKLLHRSLAEEQTRLLREAQAMAQLAHPNVVAVHDVGRVDQQVFIALELIDGPTLSAWMADGPHAATEVLSTLAQAARGLVAAHDAGIVHRDFKPDNAMIGADGRVRVLDFGLARGRIGETGPALVDRSVWMTTLTVNGALVGTPHYMSPEQYRGEPADERSDQFSFCVVLHEALYGQRPFAGNSFEELSEAVRSGRVREPTQTARPGVPKALRRALRRGLSVDPTQRWPSMRALLDALERATRRRPWRWVGGGAVVASLGVGGWWWVDREARLTACVEEGNTVVAAWTRRRPLVEAGLQPDGSPTETSRRALDELDAYAKRWSEVRVRQCEAARVRQTLSEELWGRMEDCLDDRSRSFGAVTKVLSEPEGAVVLRALEIVGRLDAVESCLDHSGLLRRLDLPNDVDERSSVGALRAELAEADVLAAAGEFKGGAALAGAVLERAEALGYAPLTVEAMYWTGAFAARGDDGTADLVMLENAAERAGEVGHERIAASAAMELLVAHTNRANFEVAEVWGRFSRVAVARLDRGETPELAVFVHTRLASLARSRGDYDAAADELATAEGLARTLADTDLRPLGVVFSGQGTLALEQSENAKGQDLLRRALDILEHELGPDHPEVGVAAETLAIAHMRLRELERADILMERGLRVHALTSGKSHPLYARSLNNRGQLRMKQQRFTDARRLFEQAVSISDAASGPDTTVSAKYRKSLALASVRLGDYPTALSLDREVLRILTAELGPDHPTVASAQTATGMVLRRLGRMEEARQHYTRALEALEKTFPDGERRTANVLNNLGVLSMLESDVAEAERMHRRALAIRTRVYPEGHSMIVVSQLRLGEALCGLNRCDEGQPILEQGLAAARKGLPPKIHAQGLLALAGVLQSSDRRRAEALTDQARELVPEEPAARGTTASRSDEGEAKSTGGEAPDSHR